MLQTKPSLSPPLQVSVSRSAQWSPWSSLRSYITHLATYISRAPTDIGITASSTKPLILDLRSKAAFQNHHLPASLNMPLAGLTPGLAGRDFFGDPEAVQMISGAIQTLFSTPQGRTFVATTQQSQRRVLVLCYDGGASQLATSTLRWQGVQAYCVKRGFGGLAAQMGC